MGEIYKRFTEKLPLLVTLEKEEIRREEYRLKKHCSSKVSYTKREANEKINLAHKEYGVLLGKYWCEDCGEWHITHHIRYKKNRLDRRWR